MPVVCKINDGVPTIWVQEENVSIMFLLGENKLNVSTILRTDWQWYSTSFCLSDYHAHSSECLKGRMKATPLLLSGAL